jgi:uncharacterized protein YgbK (DUF1537 family)
MLGFDTIGAAVAASETSSGATAAAVISVLVSAGGATSGALINPTAGLNRIGFRLGPAFFCESGFPESAIYLLPT